jgi:hypothetical protein
MLFVLEISPFLAGLVLGFVAEGRFSRAPILSGSIAAGCACCFFAGELSHSWIAGLAAAGVDIGAAGLGWMTAHTLSTIIRARSGWRFSHQPLTGE